MSGVSENVSGLYELIYNPHYKPERSPRSTIKNSLDGSKSSYILNNSTTHEYYEVDEVTAAIWQLMDGSRTAKDIHDGLAKQFPHLTEKDVRDTLVSLAEEGTVKGTEPEVERKRVNVHSPFQVDVSLTDKSNSDLLPLYRVLKPILRRPALIASLVFILAGFVVFSSTFVQVLADKSAFQILGSTLLGWLFYNLVVLLPVYFVHEAAHALACINYGGTPGEMGTGLFYFSPMFYIDTSDSWRLSKWARVMVSLSGPISTLMIGSILVFVSLYVPPGPTRAFAQLPAFLCFYGTLFNMSPVIENDGYYALSDLLDMPNLRGDSFSYLGKSLGRLLGGKQGAQTGKLKPRKKATLLIFAAVAGGWLVLFFYTTSTVMLYLAQDAAGAALGLAAQAAGLRFDLQAGTVDIVLILYFIFLLSGYFLLVKSSVRKLRRRRLKLETIHDKFVAVFLPLPPQSPSALIQRLLDRAKGVSSKFSHSFSVEWQVPFCVVRLKMGRALESLEEIRAEMRTVEDAFQKGYAKFLRRESNRMHSLVGLLSPRKIQATSFLIELSRQKSSYSHSDTKLFVAEFISKQKRVMSYLLHSVVSSMWTLEVEPEDYRRIQTNIFPAFLAEDFAETNLYGEVEEFKKHTVLGLDTISELVANVEKETSEVHSRIGLYQATAFLEPIRGRLVFLGRTEELKRSPLKIARLFLIQNWSGYFDEVLKEANLGLAIVERTIRHRLGSRAVNTLRDNELYILRQNLAKFRSLGALVEASLQRLKSDHEIAMAAHKESSSLIDTQGERIDVGYFKAVLGVNVDNLTGLGRRITQFEGSFKKLSADFEKIGSLVSGEYEARAERIQHYRKRLGRSYLPIVALSVGAALAGLSGILSAPVAASVVVILNAGYAMTYLFATGRQTGTSSTYTPTFDSIETLLLSTTQSLYEVVSSADLLALSK